VVVRTTYDPGSVLGRLLGPYLYGTATPGQLVFGRDMIFNIKHEANWELIRKRKQQLIKKNNEAKNAKRIPHTYNIGDKVLIRRGTENKYEAPYEGPYTLSGKLMTMVHSSLKGKGC
jgi:hypothetical protein